MIRLRSGVRRLALLVALLAGGVTHPARAQDVGEAMVSPREGGSRTAFTVRPPEGSTCPGDSADDGYRVNSYMVPSTVAPNAITFDGLGPTPQSFGDYATFREPLFDLETNSFASAQTADAERPREPGPIINIPRFSFAVYEPGDLPVGRYRVGIACTLLNEVVTIWSAELVVTSAPSDRPAQVRWSVIADAADHASGAPGAPIVWAVVALGAGALLIHRRRKPQLTTTRMEDS